MKPCSPTILIDARSHLAGLKFFGLFDRCRAERIDDAIIAERPADSRTIEFARESSPCWRGALPSPQTRPAVVAMKPARPTPRITDSATGQEFRPCATRSLDMDATNGGLVPFTSTHYSTRPLYADGFCLTSPRRSSTCVILARVKCRRRLVARHRGDLLRAAIARNRHFKMHLPSSASWPAPASTSTSWCVDM